MLALVLGMHWLLLATTGSILIFHREIEANLIDVGEPVLGLPDIDSAVATVQARSLEPVKFVVIADRPIRALRVFSENRIDTVDAASQDVLSTSGINGGSAPTGVFRFIYLLHSRFSAGVVGEWLVGTSGAFLLVTVIVGIVLAWPAKGSWGRTLRPRLVGKAWQKHYLLHRATGLFVALGIVLAAVSGMGIIWGKLALEQVEESPEQVERKIEKPTVLARAVTANEAVALALAELPDAEFVRVDLPTELRPSYRIRLREPGEFRPVFGTSIVEISERDGSVSKVSRASEELAGRKTVDAMFPLHNGTWLGFWGRIFIILQGFGLIYLLVSGFIIWRSRRPKQLTDR